MASVTSPVWWANQGTSFEAYEHDREGGYLWAPTRDTTGWNDPARERLKDMSPGDVTLHYVRTFLRDIGVVRESATLGPRPSKDLDYYDKEGRLVRVKYFHLEHPIHRDEIPLEWRLAGTPFNSLGNVQNRFVLAVDSAFAEWLRETFRYRWPADSPWGRE